MTDQIVPLHNTWRPVLKSPYVAGGGISVYLPSTYGTSGPSATGAQNRDAIQAAINAASTAGGGTVWIGEGVWNLDKAGSADPYTGTADYCLWLKKNVNLEGTGTLRIANNQLVVSPSLRQLAIVSMGSASTAATAGNNRIVGLTFDGNPKNQNGYSTYAQLGATMGVRCVPGSASSEVMSDLRFDRLTFRDFFGNPINVGGGGAQFIQRVTARDIDCYRCGEGLQLIRCQWVHMANLRYTDDNPTTLLGVGTGFVTVGDTHEFADCRDVVIVGVYVNTDRVTAGSGGGSGLDLYNSQRVKVFGGSIYWSSGIECGFPAADDGIGSRDIEIYGVRVQNPTVANTGTPGIDCCPNLVLNGCTVIDHGIPIRLGSGTRSVTGTGCTVSATDCTITGGGANLSAAVYIGRGGVFRATNLQISGLAASVAGVRLINLGTGVAADTRLELTGGRIVSTGEAIQVDGQSSSFTPTGFVYGMDATGSNSGSWPFTGIGSGNWSGIEVRDCQPKLAVLPGQINGAEVIQTTTAQTALDGSKNQRVFLQVTPVADPYTPSGSVAFGATSGSLANRIVLRPHLTSVSFENGAGPHLLRDSNGVYNEIGRSYPVHQDNRTTYIFTCPAVPGATIFLTPGYLNMPTNGRVTRFLVRPATPGASRSAGSIGVDVYGDGALQFAALININAANPTGSNFTYGARVGRAFTAASTLGFRAVISSDFTWTGGPSDVVVELSVEQ